ncbi:hypothetical protein E2C01_040252 [Portunus trituberculatus]|uniref:Uncharacterized protein n=1 Tax=Portunus trituberculatus TaxID=210409 RepID=A0A5B7FJ71_PORTR|nr:hypothetical protein [Portunus trituberculatus]
MISMLRGITRWTVTRIPPMGVFVLLTSHFLIYMVLNDHPPPPTTTCLFTPPISTFSQVSFYRSPIHLSRFPAHPTSHFSTCLHIYLFVNHF